LLWNGTFTETGLVPSSNVFFGHPASAAVSEARAYLEMEVMAALQIWLRDLLSEPVHSTRRREKQLFSREFKVKEHEV
jgi:hypothetical protein